MQSKECIKRKAAECRKLRRIKWQKWLIPHKTACSVCGYNTNMVALDFHHVDGSYKEITIGTFTAGNTCSLQNKIKVLKEIKKCIVLCANCHRIIHSK